MNYKQLDAIAKSISSKQRCMMLEFILHNPGCRFKDITQYMLQTRGHRPSHSVMFHFAKAGLVHSERRGRNRHYTIALAETDPLYWVIFDDDKREPTTDIVASRVGVELTDVCYAWNHYRRKAMKNNDTGTHSIDAIAEKAGLPKTWLLRFSHGYVDVTLRDFLRLCKLVGIKGSKILATVDK
jgi:hypothetical protein